MTQDIGTNIREARIKNDWSQDELARRMGYKSKSTISKIEKGINDVSQSQVKKFSEVLGVSISYLMGWNRNIHEASRTVTNALTGIMVSAIPVLSTVPCGNPKTVYENIDPDDFVEIDSTLAATKEYYGLRAKGNSMLPKIEEGDTLIVHFQKDVESGQVAIVKVNGEDATCKRIKKYRDGIELIGFNPSFEPRFFTEEEIKTKPVEIIGRVIEVRSKL